MAQSRRWASAIFCSTLLLSTSPGAAGLGDFLNDVGRTLGKPFGGFVESLVTPSLRAVNDTVVADVDRRMEQRIEQVNRSAGGLLDQTDAIVTSRVAQVDQAVAARLGQVDSIMVARIAQVGVTGQVLIDHAVGRLDGTLEKNIKLAGAEARKAIAALDDAGKARLVQVDGIMEARITQLQGVTRQSIADVDQALEQRLDQVDEISERRVGNLDVIGTRQILNLESTVVRLAGLAATLALVVLMLYSLGRELWKRWQAQAEELGFFRRVQLISDLSLLLSLGRVVVAHVVILGVCVGVLALVAKRAPKEVASREQALLAQHQAGFATGERALDYRTALYHASQLAIIEPTTSASYELRTQKLKLIRDTLGRPGIFERPETVRNLARQIATLNDQLKRATQREDPDLLTLQCYIRWQVAQDRPMEAAAAADCSKALLVAASTREGAFLLERLARHYVHVQRFFPSFGAPPPAEAAPASDAMPGLEHVASYDALVQQLDADSTSAYLALLDAQADCVRAQRAGPAKPRAKAPIASDALVAARGRRERAAENVVAAWKRFDEQLSSNAWLSGTSSELGVFLLNDAIITRALYVLAVPDAEALPGKIKDIADPLVRLKIAPPRIEWMRRYLGWLGDTARRIATYEESQRFSDFEDQVLDFEAAYVAFKAAENATAEQRIAAARAAAVLTLYVSTGAARVALSATLLGGAQLDAERSREIEQLSNARRVRLL